ncbi:hypothetical protein Dimus_022372 [Dionaea muscipula]
MSASNPDPEPDLASYPHLFRTLLLSNPTRIPKPAKASFPSRPNLHDNYRAHHGVDPDPDLLPLIDAHQEGPVLEEKLGEACRDWGIFRLVNHGIPVELLRGVEDHAKRLFELSFESKRALFAGGDCSGGGPPPVAYFWGTPALTPSGIAHPLRSQHINWFEGLNFPLGQLSQFRCQDPLAASFRKLLEEYGRHMSRLARTIFEVMLKSLGGLEVQQRHNYLDESTGLVRVYRYPPMASTDHDDDEDDDKVMMMGMKEHTDSSVVSILMQNEVRGLRFLKDDKWLHVNPVSDDSLIVNLGDMMQAISDDEYKSVRHGVQLNERGERISVCYFVFPKETSLIQSCKYKPFTYNDFRAQVQLDLATLGCKVGLERFKLDPDQEFVP